MARTLEAIAQRFPKAIRLALVESVGSSRQRPVFFVFLRGLGGDRTRYTLEPIFGLEPKTCALRKHCSTTELNRRKEREDNRGGSLVKGRGFC